MDEDDMPTIYTEPPIEIVQLADALCRLAIIADSTKDKNAKAHLISAMDSIAYMMDPPRGKLVEVKE